jgi:hypothetical protein
MHGIAVTSSLIHAPRRFGLGFPHKRAHRGVGRALNQEMEVLGQHRLGENPDASSLTCSADGIGHDRHVGGAE